MKNIIKIILFFSLSISFLQAQDTLKIRAGWNIIGATTTGLRSQLRTEPADIILSYYFGYSPTGYTATDTLQKGEGYWVRASQPGIVILEPMNLAPVPPSNPSPVDIATGIGTDISLLWACSDPENDSLTYDVYFGTDNPPTTKVGSELNVASFERNGLSNSTTYYWYVVAMDDHHNSTSSPVWNFTTIAAWACGTQVPYEGMMYNTVKIGNQCWFKENLNVGTMIDSTENPAENGSIEKYCISNDSATCTMYGGLYQWNEAVQYSSETVKQGICPSGWHIPTPDDFGSLTAYVSNHGNYLKAIGQGSGDGAGSNETGFSGLLTGVRQSGGYFFAIEALAGFWSSSEYDSGNGLFMNLSGASNDCGVYSTPKNYGFNVRCIKD